MARERYDAKIKCPSCNQERTLRVSENDYSFMKKLDRSITVANGDFEAKMINDSDALISCKSCSSEFQW